MKLKNYLYNYKYYLFGVLLLKIIIFNFFLIEEVFARAGGGGGFGGGGGGGGSYSGGSGGGGGDGEGLVILIRLLVHLTIKYPLVGIPLDILVIIGFIYITKANANAANSGYKTYTIKKAYNHQNSNLKNLTLKKLQEQDSLFSIDIFNKRCSIAFEKIQYAWAKQDMKPVRHLISDGIFERFNAYLEMQKASMLRNIMENVSVLNTEIVSVESDDFFDTIHILIKAKAIDYTIDSETNNIVQGTKKQFDVFKEYWSFLRRPGAKTSTKGGLVEGFCPNCAAPLELNDKIECESCKAIVNSGQYDWVLAEITQESEWKGIQPKKIPGVEELRKKDPSFNVQHLEDRTSVMFWRLREAEFFASSNYLTKLSDTEFINKNKVPFQKMEDGRHKFYQDSAVGCVDLLNISIASNNSEFDYANVLVRWSGHKEIKKVPSLMKPQYHLSKIYQHEFVLKRKSTSKTSEKHLLTSIHCTGCGAPETINTKNECEYCGMILNDGTHDWILKDVRPYNAYNVSYAKEEESIADDPRFAIPILSHNLNVKLIISAISIMNADGHIDDREKKWLINMAKKRNISKSELDSLIDSVIKDKIPVIIPNNIQEGKHFAKAMVRMCLMDGRVTAAEKRLLKAQMSKLGYSELDLNYMITREKNILYSLAKKQLRSN